MGNQAVAYGHIGLLLGIMALMLLVTELYAVVAPYMNAGAALFFPLIAWALGILFVVGEWYELKPET